MASRWPYLESEVPLAFAHRGGALEAPENTMAAFQRAVDLGFEYLETDIRATADGKAIVFHDAGLDRVADSEGVVENMVWADVQKLRVSGEPIPSLDELVSSFPDVRFNIDPKSDRAVKPLIAAVREHDAIDRICIGSFKENRIATCREELGPRLCTSMGPLEMVRLWLASFGLPVGKFKAACAQLPPKLSFVPIVTERLVSTAADAGLDVHVWTIDDADEMNRLFDLGVRGVMTDRPSVLRDVMVQRSYWS